MADIDKLDKETVAAFYLPPLIVVLLVGICTGRANVWIDTIKSATSKVSASINANKPATAVKNFGTTNSQPLNYQEYAAKHQEHADSVTKHKQQILQKQK